MSLKKTATSFWPEFKTRLSGSRVRSIDKGLKKMNAMANENGHSIYMKASKKPLGWGITPKHEQFRNQQVQNDEQQQRLYDAMSRAQVKRKAASRDTNRARLALGGVILGGAGLATGATLLAKKMHDKKKQKEQEESYYKTAAMKDIAVKAKDGVVATGKQIAENFAHAPELDHMYGGNLVTRLGNIAKFTRVREANRILRHNGSGSKPYSIIKNTKGNVALENLNSRMKTLNNAYIVGSNWDAEKKKSSPTIGDYQAQAEHIMSNRGSMSKKEVENLNKNPKNKSKISWNDPVFSKKDDNVNRINTNQEDLLRATKPIKNSVDGDFSGVRKTRNNELAKTVGLYAIPVAATAGGIMLYKRHKKKKRQKEQENKNQIK